jgi:predicted RNase H-like HicB family nuclease
MRFGSPSSSRTATRGGAYVSDLPGCVPVGRSRDEVERLITEAIPLHIESMREQGEPVPVPTAVGSTR